MEANALLQPAVEEDCYRGHCYCGAVHYSISKKAAPHTALYCHCESCRRAHASPLYQVVYVPQQAFKITCGEDKINAFNKPGAGVTRAFCAVCGSRMYNTLARDGDWWGFFPATLEETLQHALPAQFAAQGHHLAEEAVMDTNMLRAQPTVEHSTYIGGGGEGGGEGKSSASTSTSSSSRRRSGALVCSALLMLGLSLVPGAAATTATARQLGSYSDTLPPNEYFLASNIKINQGTSLFVMPIESTSMLTCTKPSSEFPLLTSTVLSHTHTHTHTHTPLPHPIPFLSFPFLAVDDMERFTVATGTLSVIFSMFVLITPLVFPVMWRGKVCMQLICMIAASNLASALVTAFGFQEDKFWCR